MYFCDIQCKSQWQKLRKPVNEEWLRDAYLTKGLNCTQIAHIVKRDPKSVWNWLKDFGIPTRPRGYGDLNRRFKKGEESAFKGKKHTDKYKEAVRQRRLQDGHVPYLKNGIHWLKATGRRPGSWKGGITPERQAFYSTPEWSDAVKAVWKRDDAICQRCKLDHRTIERGKPQFTIHHIDSFKIRERRAVVENLILLCRPCHYWVHSKKNTRGEYLGKGH
jgi:hypothetical protein